MIYYVIFYLNFSLEYEYEECLEKDRNALENYIATSENIIKVDFDNSPFDALEKLILDPITNIKLCAGAPEYDPNGFNKTFIALIAPSFSGKTQSAFVMRKVRP